MESREYPAKLSRMIVVVGIDFSEASRFALALAKNLVRTAGSLAELHLVHVLRMEAMPDAVAEVLPGLGPSVSSTMERTRKDLVDLCIATAQGTEARIVPHVILGETAEELSTLAGDVAADLVVVGAPPHSGLSQALHRPLSARLTELSPCCVMAAKPRRLAPTIEPPCPQCVTARRESAGKAMWCDRHSQRHIHPHRHYEYPPAFGLGTLNFRP